MMSRIFATKNHPIKLMLLGISFIFLLMWATHALAAPPVAPTNLKVDSATATRITISWTDNSNNETDFSIEMKMGAGGAWTQTGTVGTNVATFLKNVTTGPTYYFRVRAHNVDGFSAYSNEVNSPTVAPAAPSGLSAAAISSNQINISWSDNSDNESGFKVERCQGSGCSNFSQIATAGANANGYADNGLAVNTTYTYRIRSYNGIGNSAYSNPASATTIQTVPTAPTNLTATKSSSSQINLEWSDNSNNETRFEIERCTGSGCGNFANIFNTGSNATSYSNTGLASSTTYTYRVRACNSGGCSGYSNTNDSTTDSNTPAAPTNLDAQGASSSQINLTWTDNSSNETLFEIERCQGQGCTNFSNIANATTNVTSYQDTGLPASTYYRYRLRAANGTFKSAYSNINDSQTSAPPVGAPSDLTATANSTTQITLTWTDNATNETGFSLERKSGSTGTYAQIQTFGSSTGTGPGKSYVNTGLTAGTTYFYRIRAYNAAENSAWSNEANATTGSNPPPTITNINPTSIIVGAAPASGLVITGTGFFSGAEVEFIVIPLSPIQLSYTLNSSTQITVPASQLNTLPVGKFAVMITNPDGQSASASQEFFVNNPSPTLSSISPNSKTVGEGQFTLTATGTNFVGNSKIRWEGADRNSTFVSATQLTATIPASDLTAAGTFNVTIFNPGPGGGSSAAQVFTIGAPKNPVPTTTSISPNTKTAGDPGFTLTVNGTNFIASSTVRINGQDRVTTFVSITQLTAVILNTDIATAGTYPVLVFNPGTDGNGLSNSQTLTVNPVSPGANKLAINPSGVLTLDINTESPVLTVQRQNSSGSVISAGTTAITLTSNSSGGRFRGDGGSWSASNTLNLTIPAGGNVFFYYKDLNSGTPTITALATGFASGVKNNITITGAADEPGPVGGFLTIKKTTIGGDAGAKFSFLIFDANDEFYPPKVEIFAPGQGSVESAPVDVTANVKYTIFEVATESWPLKSASCKNFSNQDAQIGDWSGNSIEVTVPEGATVECEFINEKTIPQDQYGTLTIVKETQGVGRDENFIFNINPTPSIVVIAPEKGPANTITLPVGAYEIQETLLQNTKWQFESASCVKENGDAATGNNIPNGWSNLTIGPNESIVCTFENSKIPGGDQPVVVMGKTAVGGPVTNPFQYSITPQGQIPLLLSIPVANFSSNSSGSYQSSYGQAEKTVPAGPANISHTKQTGWSKGEITCFDETGEIGIKKADGSRDIDIKPGAHINCFNNNIKEGVQVAGIQIVKSVIDANGAFNFLINGINGFSKTATINTQQNNTTGPIPADPGIYSITETLPNATWKNDFKFCEMDGQKIQTTPGANPLTLGGIKVDTGKLTICYFGNSLKPIGGDDDDDDINPPGPGQGKLKIIKKANGQNDEFKFNVMGGETTWSPVFTTQNGEGAEDRNVATGSNYSITETLPSGWKFDSATCDKTFTPGANGSASVTGVTVLEGQITTCTFENTYEGTGYLKIIKKTNENVSQDTTFEYIYNTTP